MAVQAITPVELAQRMERGEELFLLDVRSLEEYQICHIEKSIHMPAEEVYRRYEELPRDRDIVVICHYGTRAETIVVFLRLQGFRAFNLKGGIYLYSITVAPDLVLY